MPKPTNWLKRFENDDSKNKKALSYVTFQKTNIETNKERLIFSHITILILAFLF